MLCVLEKLGEDVQPPGPSRVDLKSRGLGGMVCEFPGSPRCARHNGCSDSPRRAPCPVRLSDPSPTGLPTSPHADRVGKGSQTGWAREAREGAGDKHSQCHTPCPSHHFPSCSEEYSLFRPVHILAPLGYAGGWGCPRTQPLSWWNCFFVSGLPALSTGF